MEKTYKLTENGIKYLTDIDDQNTQATPVHCDIIVQLAVYNSRSEKSPGIWVENVRCIDTKESYLFLIVSKSEVPLKIKDILHLKDVRVGVYKAHGPFERNRFILVKNYEVLGSAITILYPAALRFKRDLEQPNIPPEKELSANTLPSPKKPESKELNLQYDFLETLTPLAENRNILVKIFQKKDIKRGTSRANTTYSVLNLAVYDEKGFLEDVTVWNDQAEEIDTFDVGDVLYLTNVIIKNADRKYALSPAEYSIALSKNSRIERIENPTIKFLHPTLRIFTISELPELSIDKEIDFPCIIIEVNEVQTKQRKSDNKDYSFRKLVVGGVDGFKTELALFGQIAETEFNPGEYVLFSNVKVNEYNEIRTLSGNFKTNVKKGETVSEHQKIKKQIELEGGLDKFPWKTLNATGNIYTNQFPNEISYLKSIKDELDNISEQTSLPLKKFKVYLTRFDIKNEKCYYPACPNKKCGFKKIVADASGNGFICNKCNQFTETPVYRYCLFCKFKDASGEMETTVFGDMGEALLGISAAELKETIEKRDEQRLNELDTRIRLGKFILFARPKVSVFNNNIQRNLAASKLVFLNEDVDSSNSEAKLLIVKLKELIK